MGEAINLVENFKVEKVIFNCGEFNDLEKAFYINTLLALVGPVVLIVTTALALLGLAEKISLTRIICLFCGISLILFSLKSA